MGNRLTKTRSTKVYQSQIQPRSLAMKSWDTSGESYLVDIRKELERIYVIRQLGKMRCGHLTRPGDKRDSSLITTTMSFLQTNLSNERGNSSASPVSK